MQDRTVSTELNKVLSGTSAPSLTNTGGQSAMVGAIAGTDFAGQGALNDALTHNTTQLAQVQSAIQAQLDSLVSNTQAVIENTSAKSSGGSTAANIAGGFASSILGGGILGPIVTGLMSLFGGGSNDQTPAQSLRFLMPPKLDYETGGQGSSTGAIDYNQNGQPRAITQLTAPAPQITVNVSAMDSQSFLDRSTDIANAVRKAMLESSSLNDVIGEL